MGARPEIRLALAARKEGLTAVKGSPGIFQNSKGDLKQSYAIGGRHKSFIDVEDTGTFTGEGQKIYKKKSSPTLAQSVDRQVLSQSTGRSSTLLGG